MSCLLKDHAGTHVIMDDILVHGKTLEEHDARLAAVLKTIESSGLKLNREKCQFRKKQLTYFGHEISNRRIRPSEKKVRAITDLPVPTSVSELLSAMGMFNYMVRFIQNLSSMLEPLSGLLKKSNAWCWELIRVRHLKK